jgi:hypothetical protein
MQKSTQLWGFLQVSAAQMSVPGQFDVSFAAIDKIYLKNIIFDIKFLTISAFELTVWHVRGNAGKVRAGRSRGGQAADPLIGRFPYPTSSCVIAMIITSPDHLNTLIAAISPYITGRLVHFPSSPL